MFTEVLYNHMPSVEAKAFADKVPLYAFANPENPDGDSIATWVVKRLMQFAYDQGKLGIKNKTASAPPTVTPALPEPHREFIEALRVAARIGIEYNWGEAKVNAEMLTHAADLIDTLLSK